MADLDLSGLSLKELRQLERDVLKAISGFEDRQKVEARAKLDALAKELGYSLTDLLGAGGKTSRSPGVPKYRHPDDSSQTWSGRGRKPKWYIDHISAGKNPNDFAI
jgi:DNA-binding protein H-NS